MRLVPPGLALSLLLAGSPACAHHQPTNRTLAIGITIGVLVGALVLICASTPCYDDSPGPGNR